MSLVNDLLINLEERRGGHTDQQAVFADLSPATVFEQSGPQIVSWRMFFVFAAVATAMIGMWLYLESTPATTGTIFAEQKSSGPVQAPVLADSGKTGEESDTTIPANTSMVEVMLSLKLDDVLSQVPHETIQEATSTDATSTVIPEQSGTSGTPARSILKAVRIDAHNQNLGLNLELDGNPVYESYTLSKPDRLVIELENTDYGVASLDWSASPHIQKIRTGHHDDRLRIVFDLSKPFILADTELSAEQGSSHLQVSLVDPSFQSPPDAKVTVSDSQDDLSKSEVIENRYMEVKPRNNVADTATSETDHYQSGLQYYQQRRFDDSVTELRQVVQQEPTHARAQYYLVSALLYAGKPEEAEQQLGAALTHNPGNTELKRLYAHILMEQGKSLEALAVLADSPPPISSDMDYHALLAALLQDQQMHLEAVDIYKNLVRLRPDNGIWWMGLGISLEALSLRNEALDAYRQSLKIGKLPDNLSQYVTSRIQTLSRDQS